MAANKPPKKAPKIKSPSKKKPNYMKEYDQKTEKYSPMAPMSKKRLSK